MVRFSLLLEWTVRMCRRWFFTSWICLASMCDLTHFSLMDQGFLDGGGSFIPSFRSPPIGGEGGVHMSFLLSFQVLEGGEGSTLTPKYYSEFFEWKKKNRKEYQPGGVQGGVASVRGSRARGGL